MNYGELLKNGDPIDYNFLRYVGWDENNKSAKLFFSQRVINIISKKVSELTKGVDKDNRTIIVPDEHIAKIMDSVFLNFQPPVGDIYSRYVVPNYEQQDRVQSLIDQTIELIVSDIRNNYGIDEANEQLTAWIQVYGDFNKGGLLQHPPIKILENRPAVMQFNMNY